MRSLKGALERAVRGSLKGLGEVGTEAEETHQVGGGKLGRLASDNSRSLGFGDLDFRVQGLGCRKDGSQFFGQHNFLRSH